MKRIITIRLDATETEIAETYQNVKKIMHNSALDMDSYEVDLE